MDIPIFACGPSLENYYPFILIFVCWIGAWLLALVSLYRVASREIGTPTKMLHMIILVTSAVLTLPLFFEGLDNPVAGVAIFLVPPVLLGQFIWLLFTNPPKKPSPRESNQASDSMSHENP